MLRKLYYDEAGFIVSAEYMLIISLAFTGAAVAWGSLRDALANELNDVAQAVGTVSQTYNLSGLQKPKTGGTKPFKAMALGFGFNDMQDDCDCSIVELTDVCGKDDPSGTVPE